MPENEIEQLVVLKNYEFESFVRTDDRYSLLVDAIFSSARLGYDGETLSFDTGAIDLLMKTFERGYYKRTLEQFKEEQEELKRLMEEKEIEK